MYCHESYALACPGTSCTSRRHIQAEINIEGVHTEGNTRKVFRDILYMVAVCAIEVLFVGMACCNVKNIDETAPGGPSGAKETNCTTPSNQYIIDALLTTIQTRQDSPIR